MEVAAATYTVGSESESAYRARQCKAGKQAGRHAALVARKEQAGKQQTNWGHPQSWVRRLASATRCKQVKST